MSDSPDKPIDLRHYVRMLWRRRWIIVLCTVSVACATAVGISFVPPQYESEVTILVQDRQPLSAGIEAVMGGSRASGSFRVEEERLGRMVGRIRSRPFLERLIKILKMDEDPRIRAQARKRRSGHPELNEEDLAVRLLTQALQNRIHFGTVGPGLYKIIVVDYGPRNAQILADWVSELFVDITIQKELEYIRSTRKFGEEQLRVYEEELQRSEEALERYLGSVIEKNLSGSAVRVANLTAAEALHRRMADEAATAAARVGPLERGALAAGMAAGDTRLKDDPAVVSVGQRISQALVSAVQDLLTMETVDVSQWPPKGQADVHRRDLYKAIESMVQGLYPEATSEALRSITGYVFAEADARTQAEAASWLRASIESFKQYAQTGPAGEMALSRLQEQVTKNRELLQSFRAQMVASDVSQAVETTNLGLRMEIIDPAQLPLSPSRPNRARIFMAAMVLGPLVGVGFAFLSELLDPTLRTLDDVTRAAPEPVLGVLPLLASLRPRRSGWRRYWVPATLGGIVLLTVVFFAMKDTVLRGVGASKEPVHIVDPGQGSPP